MASPSPSPAQPAWFGWLGWDDEYWIDSDGVLQGPYETWQVVGCVLTLLAVGIVAARWWSAWGIVAVMPLAFTVAWSVTSAPGDDSGLWVVGAFLVLVGMTVACLVVAAAVRSWANRVVG